MTSSSPNDYNKRIAVIPQDVRMCLHCGGICVDQPRVGVACVICKGTHYITVNELDLPEWRAEIAKARLILDAMTPALSMADVSKLFNAVVTGSIAD